MHTLQRLARLTVVHPVTGRVYPVPAGGSGDDDPSPDTPPEPDAPEPDAPTPDPAKPGGGLPDDPEALKKEIEKLRRENAGHRTKNKELEPLAKRAKELEDAKKTEVEKLTEANSGLTERASSAEMRALRLEVALDKAPEGMPVSQIRKLAKRLAGTTEEELAADAEELFADFVTADDPKAPAALRTPKESMRPGASPDAEPIELDPAKLAARVKRGLF